MFVGTSAIKSQSVSNLEKIYNLLNNSIEVIKPLIDSDKIYFEFNSPSEYSLLKNRAVIKLSDSNIEILDNEEKALTKFNYSVDGVKVSYNKIFREGLFGDYLVEREIELSGSYIISKNKIRESDTFQYTEQDSVKYGKVNSLESSSLPFTQGNLPPEPFWKGVLEPIIAVGTAAVTVFLFFSVRSK